MKEKLTETTCALMKERFGKDSLLSLATCVDGIPYVRTVNGYYEEGMFYIITYGLSNKMEQIRKNPLVAIAGEWFTAHGIGENLGYIYNESNSQIAKKLEGVFSAWFHNGHNDYSDHNTCILRIRLTDGILFSHGNKYDIDFQSN